MFGLGMWELMIVLFIVLIVFGGGKLPELGDGLGKAIRNFKKGVADPLENKADEKEKLDQKSDA